MLLRSMLSLIPEAFTGLEQERKLKDIE